MIKKSAVIHVALVKLLV